MSDHEPDGDVARVRELGVTLEKIISGLPGSVHRVTVRAGACSVDVTWNESGLAAVPAASVPPITQGSPEREPDGIESVTARLVGAFYGRPSPEAAPFVEVGDTVEPGTQVGLIEAMKLFTPVVTETGGRVVAVHPADGAMVEFGQPLVDLAPAED
ncbi:acetyl-CoA carboxylase biotin carboxyl carrier protein [Amycolatopsis japonica]